MRGGAPNFNVSHPQTILGLRLHLAEPVIKDRGVELKYVEQSKRSSSH
jgi:hypothetical protein